MKPRIAEPDEAARGDLVLVRLLATNEAGAVFSRYVVAEVESFSRSGRTRRAFLVGVPSAAGFRRRPLPGEPGMVSPTPERLLNASWTRQAADRVQMPARTPIYHPPGVPAAEQPTKRGRPPRRGNDRAK